MAKAPKDKLVVNGTAELAAKSKPGDKHDKSELTIEQATKESPRPSRKRAGGFNDFEVDDGKSTSTVKEKKASHTSTLMDSQSGAKDPKPMDKRSKSKAKAKADGMSSTATDAGKQDVVKSEKSTKRKTAKNMTTANADIGEASKEVVVDQKARKSKKSNEPGATPDKIGSHNNVVESGSPPASKIRKGKSIQKDEGADTKGSTKNTTEKRSEKDKLPRDLADIPKAVVDKANKAAAEVKAGANRASKVKIPTPIPSSDVSTSRKRKAPGADATNSVQAELADSLADVASAAKKLKKAPRKTLGESLGGLVSSGLEAAVQGAQTLRQSFGGLLGGTGDKVVEKTTANQATTTDDDHSASKAADVAPKTGKKLKKEKNTVTAMPEVVNSDARSSDDEKEEESYLKGFESSEDDNPTDSPIEIDAKTIPPMPTSKKLKKQLAKAKPSAGTDSGVVYLGRIPHGFYEHQIRGYSEQFGSVTRLRLSRSRATGKSKHYAFIEFDSEEVASIFASTMNNYLMFGHILKCKLIPKESLHENLWKGANRQFKAVPWSKIEAKKLNDPSTKSDWDSRIKREGRKRKSKLAQTKQLGYEFEVPELKLAVPTETVSIEDVSKSEPQQITDKEDAKLSVAKTAPSSTEVTEVIKRKRKLSSVTPSGDLNVETSKPARKMAKSKK